MNTPLRMIQILAFLLVGLGAGNALGQTAVNVPASGSNTVPCGQNSTLRDHAGTGNYSNNVNGYTVLQNGNAGVITLSGTYGTETNYDFVRIYAGAGTGGALLATYSGSGSISFTGAAGQVLTVQFTSDLSTIDFGFQIGVSYSACNLPTQNVPASGSNTLPCGQSVVLQDHAGTGNYSNNVDGYTVLQNAHTGVITLSGTYSTELDYDHIRIYAGAGTGGTLLASYTGSGTISYTSAPGQTLTVRFVGDISNVSSGFQMSATYTGACVPPAVNVPVSGSNVSSCGVAINLYDNSGPFGDYNPNADGYTVLQNANTGVITLSGTYNTEAIYDLIRIYDGAGTGGTLLATYSGSGTISYTGAPGQTLTVRFKSDAFVSTPGFAISVSYSGSCTPLPLNVPASGSNTSPCGANITLHDHGGPAGDYGLNVDGYTVLQNTASGVISLSGTYSTEAGYDFVRIYAGSGTGGALLASYDNNGSFNYTSCPGQALTVRFQSDNSVVGTGFQMNVAYSGSCTTPAPAPTVSSFTPTAGCTATPVVITGTDLGCVTAVTFGGMPAASFTVNSATQITATPASSGAIAVTTAGGVTATSANSYALNATPAAPLISAGGPTTFCTGTSVTLSAFTAPATDLSFTASLVATGGVTQYQTFVPTVAGYTTGLQIHLNGFQAGTRTLSIYDGSGTGGTLLYTNTFPLGSSGWLNIPIPYAAALNLTPGATYTFAITGGYTELLANSGGYGVYYSNSYGFPGWRLNFITQVTSPAGPGLKWQLDGTDIAGATAATYAASATGTYTARLVSACAAASPASSPASSGIAVTVRPTGQWLGISADWNTGANWCGGVPTATSDIIIPASGSVPFMPILTAAGSADDISLENGSLLTVASGGNLALYGSLTNTGTGALSAGSGTVTFAGPAAQTIMPGFTTGTLIVSGGSAKTLSGPVTVNTQLSFSTGMLDVGSNRLTMGSGATIAGASATQYVRTSATGGRLQQGVGSTPVVFPVGNTTYNPSQLSNTGAPDVFSVGVRDEVLTGGDNGPAINPTAMPAVARSWDVEEATPGGSIVALGLEWSAGNTNSAAFDYTNVYVSHYNGGGWDGDPAYPNVANTPTASGYPGSGPYSALRNGLTSFSPFTVRSAGGSAPLSVTLVKLTASNAGTRNKVEWQSASEQHLAAYVVVRSTDGRAFTGVEKVAPLGGTSQSYISYDSAPADGLSYYRLKMVDADGSFAYSPVAQVFRALSGKVVVQIAPNPVRDVLTVSVYGAADGNVQLTDVAGRVVTTAKVDGGRASINTATLATGSYFLKWTNGVDSQTFKVSKQ